MPEEEKDYTKPITEIEATRIGDKIRVRRIMTQDISPDEYIMHHNQMIVATQRATEAAELEKDLKDRWYVGIDLAIKVRDELMEKQVPKKEIPEIKGIKTRNLK